MTTSTENRLRKSDWTVRDIEIAVARRMVEKYHYAAGASNTATYLHGLFREGDIFEEQCCAVAWWIPPTRSAAEATFPQHWQGVLSLSRLVVCPEVPKNACTFLLARSRALIDSTAWPCLVTYADDWRGHTGGIYKADNWRYVGKTKPERTYQIDGRMVARKAGGKTRTHAEMLALGAQMVGSFAKHKFVMIRGGKRIRAEASEIERGG
jgi:hypothetical protein